MPMYTMGWYGTGKPRGAAQAPIVSTVGAAVGTTAASNSTPFGYTTAVQADRVIALLNELRTETLAQTALLNELRRAMVESGLIVGGV